MDENILGVTQRQVQWVNRHCFKALLSMIKRTKV